MLFKVNTFYSLYVRQLLLLAARGQLASNFRFAVLFSTTDQRWYMHQLGLAPRNEWDNVEGSQL